MMNEEAIAILRNEKEYTPCYKKKVALGKAIKALEQELCEDTMLKDIFCMGCKYKNQEPCEDYISRQALKQKLQEHHDFFVNAYGGFNNLSLNDKFKVDEITNCIAMVVNEPSVTPQPKIGEWLEKEVNSDNAIEEWQSARCSVCDKYHTTPYMYYFSHYDYCPHCGTKMEGRQKLDKGRSKRNR